MYFIMCHDGASSGLQFRDKGPEEQSDMRDASVETQEASRKMGLRAMIYVLIRQGYNIALINGLEFIDTKVRSALGLGV